MSFKSSKELLHTWLQSIFKLFCLTIQILIHSKFNLEARQSRGVCLLGGGRIFPEVERK